MVNAAEVESLLDKMLEWLKARGYARSGLTHVEVIPLSENIVLVSDLHHLLRMPCAKFRSIEQHSFEPPFRRLPIGRHVSFVAVCQRWFTLRATL